MEAEQESAGSAFSVGDWQVDPGAGRVWRGAEETRLEPRTMAVLCYLAARPGERVTREELEREIWSGMVVGYDALTGAINKIRKALQDNSRNPRYIETLPKKGYRLVAAVTSAGSGLPAAPAEPEQPPSAPRSLLLSIRARPVVAGLAAAATVLGVLLTIFQGSGGPGSLPGPTLPSIVVLPFESVGTVAGEDYFADGITEDLTTDLSRMSKLMVIARRSAFVYKGKKVDPRTVGRELNVRYVLQGNVRKSGDRVRVNTELVDAHSGFEIWAERYDHKLEDIFRLQDRLREKIVSALSIALTEKERAGIARRYTRSVAAYDSFLRGQSFLVRQTATDNKAARQYFQDAISRDTSFARAHSALALTHVNDYRFSWSAAPDRSAQLARDFAREALRLDERSPQAHWVLGMVHLFVEGRQSAAIEMGQRTVDIDPNDADGLALLAAAYIYDDQPVKSRILIEKAKRLNPFYSSQYPSILGLSFLLTGEYEQSIAAYRDSLAINPGRMQTNLYMILAYLRAGKKDEAAWQLEQFRLGFPSFSLEEWLSRQPYRNRQILEALARDLRATGMR